MRALRLAFESALVGSIDLFLRFLPWERAQAVGACIGGAARHVARQRWRLTLDNLERAFPERPAAVRRGIALEAWRNAGRVAAESVRSRYLSKAELAEVVEWENPELCDALIAEGKGVLMNIGHMGNWELAGIAFTARGYPLGVVGRVMKNPRLDAWVRETRSRFGMVLFSHRNPFFEVVRWLKKGRVTAILIDHNLYHGGVFVPLFDRPAATSTLSALLAVKLGCPIISARIQRDGPRLRIRFDGPLRSDPAAQPEREIERLTVEMSRTLEGYIRERPGEWLWGHNRWKRVPAAGEAVLRLP